MSLVVMKRRYCPLPCLKLRLNSHQLLQEWVNVLSHVLQPTQAQVNTPQKGSY